MIRLISPRVILTSQIDRIFCIVHMYIMLTNTKLTQLQFRRGQLDKTQHSFTDKRSRSPLASDDVTKEAITARQSALSPRVTSISGQVGGR